MSIATVVDWVQMTKVVQNGTISAAQLARSTTFQTPQQSMHLGGFPVADQKSEEIATGTKFVEAVFLLYRKSIERFIARRLADPQTAEDVSQEVFLRLLRVEDTDLVRQPRAYVFRIASNVAYEMMLRARNEPITFDSDVIEYLANLGDNAAPDMEKDVSNARQLDLMLSSLPPLHRAILLLRKRDGRSNAQIARQLGISTHTVIKYLTRALAQCKSSEWER